MFSYRSSIITETKTRRVLVDVVVLKKRNKRSVNVLTFFFLLFTWEKNQHNYISNIEFEK